MDCCDSKSKNVSDKSVEKKDPIDTICPICLKKGSKVQTITLNSLLIDSCKNLIKDDNGYRFCKTPDCEVAYYSKEADQTFTINQLKVPATVKDKSLDVNVCYCFDYKRIDILNEIKTQGDSKAADEIKLKMKDPGCFCEISNPQGTCCLGNVNAWIKEAKQIIDKG